MTVQTSQRGRTLIVRAGRGHRPAPPGRSYAPIFGLAVVLVLSAVAVVPLLSRRINPYDEGLIAYGAEQVLRGRVPSVDFYSPYGPGVFYLVAAAYRLFGTRLLVERWVAGALIIAVGALGYWLLVSRETSAPAARGIPLRRVSGGAGDSTGRHPRFSRMISGEARLVAISAAAGLLVVLTLVSGWWYTPVNSGALALMLLSGLALQRGLAGGTRVWAVATGVAGGILLLWRLLFGGALLMANALAWALMAGDGARARRPNSRWVEILAMLATAGAIALPVYGVMISMGGRRTVQSLFVWPLTSTGAADLPWPTFSIKPPRTDISSLSHLAAATHGAAFYYGVVAIALLLWRVSLGPLRSADRRLGLWLLLMLPPLFLYGNGRTDYAHITPLLTLSLLLAGLCLDSGLAVASRPGSDHATSLTATPQAEHPNRRGRLRVALNAAARLVLSGESFRCFWQGVGLLTWAASVLLLTPTILYSWSMVWATPGRTPLELPGPRGAGVYPSFRAGRQYRALVPLIHQYVAPAQTIFSGTSRHDIFLTNDILLYFLADRDAPTYYWCLEAGVTTSAPVQKEMLAEMSRGAVAAAVVWTAPKVAEKNAGAQSSRVFLVDDWLKREFSPLWLPGLFYDLRIRNLLWSQGMSDQGLRRR